MNTQDLHHLTRFNKVSGKNWRSGGSGGNVGGGGGGGDRSGQVNSSEWRRARLATEGFRFLLW